jgi:predicted NAD/FAD-binding protein
VTRIAVIGSGISGLAAAYYLSRRYEVHVFEKETRLGGHTHTVIADSSKGKIPIDTGFIVHNEKTYPNFCRLLAELGVETAWSDMSFGVQCRATHFEYSSRGARGFFADRRNALRAAHWVLLREILRFNREAPRLLLANEGEYENAMELTLGEFLESGKYSTEFLERYLYPMSSAVWSMPPPAAAQFPAITLIRFFANHGMLGINTHPRWKFLKGGSHSYIAPLTTGFRDRVQTGVDIHSVTRTDSGVTLHFADWPALTFDHVVFACHGDQVLPLLGDPSPEEREVFSSFATSRNEAVLHTDDSLLPRRPDARASWNYHVGDASQAAVTYHMNRLQSLTTRENYCVTLNSTGEIDSTKVIRRMIYRHPLYTLAAVRAQKRWREVSGARHTHYCGAYWFYGFHEDGVNSALRVASALGVHV